MNPPCDTPLSEVQRLTLLYGTRRARIVLKRCFDALASGFLIIILSPLFLALAIAVKLSSKGAVIFHQDRVGQGGKNLQMLKFRTMYTELTEEIQASLQRHQEAGTLLKSQDDPRVTPLGRWLRRTSLDELPQLFNVLQGTMSLVGPRPLMLHLARPFPNFVRARSLVKPGITGLWQIRERENFTSAIFMMPHDLEYIEKFGLPLDIEILLKTIPALLGGRGAC